MVNEALKELAEDSPFSKSDVARAAMNIGLDKLRYYAVAGPMTANPDKLFGLINDFKESK